MITAVCAVALPALLAGSDLAHWWRGSRTEPAPTAQIAGGLDGFQSLARHNVVRRDHASGSNEIRASITARERAKTVGNPER